MKTKAIVCGILLGIFVLSTASSAYAANGAVRFAWIVSSGSNWKNGKSIRYTAYVWAEYGVGSDRGSFTLRCTIKDRVGWNPLSSTLGQVSGSATSQQKYVDIYFTTSQMTVTLNGGGTHNVFGQCSLSTPSGTLNFNTSTDSVKV
jgi:hypothetical protein